MSKKLVFTLHWFQNYILLLTKTTGKILQALLFKKLYTVKMSYWYQMNPKVFLCNTVLSTQLPCLQYFPLNYPVYSTFHSTTLSSRSLPLNIFWFSLYPRLWSLVVEWSQIKPIISAKMIKNWISKGHTLSPKCWGRDVSTGGRVQAENWRHHRRREGWGGGRFEKLSYQCNDNYWSTSG